MKTIARKLTKTFSDFYNSEKSSGIVLIASTICSVLIANSDRGAQYLDFWQMKLGGLSIEHWVNDALMAVFFLLIGLELEREIYNGELSDFKNALLPLVAALGGLVVPALIHFSLNAGSETQGGFGIPMATDIAFALGVLAIIGSRIPASLKVFVVAFAVIDDLCAIIIIAVFYTAHLSVPYLAAALTVWLILVILNRFFRVKSMVPYLLGGVVLWVCLLQSGVHATIAGVLLAFAVPFSHREDDETSPSHRLEHLLHKPVAFLVLPIFALVNTGVLFGGDWANNLTSPNNLGIVCGLLAGKALGITLASLAAVTAGICRLPADLNWKHLFGAGLLGGIGFTMSIFITNLAFAGNDALINDAKIAILLASFTAGMLGFLWLQFACREEAAGLDEV